MAGDRVRPGRRRAAPRSDRSGNRAWSRTQGRPALAATDAQRPAAQTDDELRLTPRTGLPQDAFEMRACRFVSDAALCGRFRQRVAGGQSRREAGFGRRERVETREQMLVVLRLALRIDDEDADDARGHPVTARK